MTALPRFYILGGFLGAGKTTTLLHLARRFHEAGRRVGLITNDQAADLVDTGNLRVRGFRVEEVAGACFCCKFDDLAASAEKLRIEERPDVLLGEPVGSCTDLAATVVSPLRRLYGDRYSIAPYSVLVDPIRARELVIERGHGGFSAKVAYIFRKQLEEANVIVLNKVDTLAPCDRDDLLGALAREFPRAAVVSISGRSGEGVDEWLALLDRSTAPANITSIDYDVYAEGEAELGWLNVEHALKNELGIDTDALALSIVSTVARELASRRREVAHVKVFAGDALGASIANDVGGVGLASLSQSNLRRPVSARLTLNARAHCAPGELRAIAEAACDSIFPRFAADVRVVSSACFRPGRPVPIHRDPLPA